MRLSYSLFLCLGCVVMEVASQTELTEDDKQEILDIHNILRGSVTPTATNMERMVWSDELAKVAQTHAERCVFAHNADRSNMQDKFGYVGENLYIYSGAADYTSTIQGWYDEGTDYDYNTVSCNAVCGHYTQIVWANSAEIGCGVYRCPQISISTFIISNALNLICNYGPGGNLIGQAPYESGASCSNCPVEKSNCVDNLCTAATVVPSTTTATATSSTTPTPATPPPTSSTGTPPPKRIINWVANGKEKMLWSVTV